MKLKSSPKSRVPILNCTSPLVLPVAGLYWFFSSSSANNYPSSTASILLFLFSFSINYFHIIIPCRLDLRTRLILDLCWLLVVNLILVKLTGVSLRFTFQFFIVCPSLG
ncbi:hypothetical protein ACH5RR_003626 [Cinchona calisaya]|uniref:Transmembrane protein n=1 Tax=Cinchona calisaya TaxID=153742 RepID=A0ABD3AV99_9GENT